jgi:chloramphenicol 3-O-phosphotransferase
VGTEIIVLNGGSSSGKTSIARCLQGLLPEPWLTLGVDDLVAALPSPVPGREPLLDFGADGQVGVGPGFYELEAAWTAGVAAIAHAGVGVIVDDVFLGGGRSQARLRRGLAGLGVLWVGVRCSATVAASREALRPDRVPGMAMSQAEVVHDGAAYDLEVDTTGTPAESCARVIRSHVAVSGPRSPRQLPVVATYDAEWPRRAATLIAKLKEVLSPLAKRVEHIGSTAVPGMAAKAVIDLQVSVDDLAAAATLFDVPLRGLGFTRSPYERDHVPAGRVEGPELWAKRLWSRRGHPDGDVNLHVRRVGSANERLALLFRDWFRVHRGSVPAYAAFKRSLADVTLDIGPYTEVKDPVVDLVISVAEPWAASVGWHP